MPSFTNKESKGLQNIQARLGVGIFPSWTVCLEKMQALKKTNFPRSFFWANQVKDNKILYHAGLDKELAYDKNIELTPEFLLGTMHPNQRSILIQQIIAVFNLVLKYPKDFNNRTYLYGAKRAFKDGNDKYWLVYQTSEVLQWDNKEQIATNFNWFHILGAYKGEPLETEIFHNKQTTQKAIIPLTTVQKEFDDYKAKLLGELGFTTKQQTVIELMAIHLRTGESENLFNQKIATDLKLSIRTIQGHRTKILQLGKIIFPLNTFKDAIDVVRHLMVQDLIKK